jgi:hypothetical protein
MVSRWSQTSLPYQHRRSMAPGKESKASGWLKPLRRIFSPPNSRPHFPAETSTANINIPNDDLRDRPRVILSTSHSSSQRSSALLGTDSADIAGGMPGVKGDRSRDSIFSISHPSSQQSSSHPETNISEKAWRMTQSGLLTALRLLERSADAFPPLKSVVGGLIACVDLAQVSHRHLTQFIMSYSHHR